MLKPLDATVLEKSLQLVTDAFVNASSAAVKHQICAKLF
jgi:hypothetical protein